MASIGTNSGDTNGLASTRVRTRSVGEILDATFRQYRKFFSFWAPLAIYILVPYYILVSIFAATNQGMYSSLFNTIRSISSKASPVLADPQTQPSSAAESVLNLLNFLVVQPLFYGTILVLVTEWLLYGRVPGRGEAFRHSLKRLLPTLATNVMRIIVYGVLGAISVVLVLVVLGGSVVGSALGNAPGGVTVLAMILIGLASLVVGVWLLVRFSFMIPVTVMEKKTFWSPLTRSWVLTRRNFWRTLGLFVLIGLITGVVTSVMTAIIGVIFMKSALVVTVLTSIVGFFVSPLPLLAAANLYVDLRIRADALDLDDGSARITEE